LHESQNSWKIVEKNFKDFYEKYQLLERFRHGMLFPPVRHGGNQSSSKREDLTLNDAFRQFDIEQ